jgi:hypothetical protein
VTFGEGGQPPQGPPAPVPDARTSWSAPRYGEYAPAPDTSWQQGAVSAPGAPGPYTWTPPPKPGLIPLRPLTLGDLLGADFRVLRRNPRPVFGTTLLLYGAMTLVFTLVLAGLAYWAYGRITSAAAADQDEIVVGTLGLAALVLLLPTAGSVVVQAIVQGLISAEVARATLGEKLTTRQLFRSARGRIGALIGWSFAISGVTMVAIIVVVAVVSLLIALGGAVGIVVGVLFAVLASLAALVLTVWLSTKLQFVPSALVLEHLSLRDSIVRSWRLTRGSFWRVFGITILVALIVNVATNIVTTPVSFVAGIIGGLTAPTGDPTAEIMSTGILTLVSFAIGLLAGALGAVVQSANSALLYLDLRMRREGLDLELIRFVEARQAGDSTVADPYTSTGQRSE